MILDEVQCGMGRTGRLFAHEWAGVAPDIMMVAKGIGGGFPLGAVLATEAAARGMTAGTHGSTYGGNPLACAVGLAVMELVDDPTFLEGVRRRAAGFAQALQGVVDTNPDIFAELRGSGLMLGLRCHVPVAGVAAACREAGLLAVPAAEDVLRLLPALDIPEAELAEAAAKLDAAAATLRARATPAPLGV